METATETQKEARFNTIEQVLEDPKCSEYIKERIQEIVNHRYKALQDAGSGARMRQSPYDYLTAKKMLSAKPLIAEFKLINAKKSPLSSAVREYITGIVFIALNKTITHYHELDNKVEE